MTRLVVLFALALAPALALPRAARADNPSLGEARVAVDEIRYDEARALLVQALKHGGSRPEELVEIYRLSGATAAVLGAPDLAEQYYRRMLALAPDATLPPDASPRLRDPFVAAQAYMAAQQRFELRATRTDKGIVVSVVDPLGMVVAVATLERGVVRGKAALVGANMGLGDDRPHVLEHGDEVVALDEHGNFLRVVSLPAREAVVAAAPPSRPLFQRPLSYAVPAVVLAGTATYFFIDASRAKTRLDDILDNDGMHFFDDAERERKRWRTSTFIGWTGAGLAAALGTTAIIMAARSPSVRVTPSVSSDAASVQLEANF